MREELDKRLCEKYPEIFAQRRGDMSETCMCWGICVGDGWYDLIDALCATIQNAYDNAKRQYDADIKYNEMIAQCQAGDFSAFDEFFKGFSPAFVVTQREGITVGAIGPRKVSAEPIQTVAVQVKEKFGGLRFYVDYANEAVNGAIALAESMSFRMCEDCGSPGTTTRGGWISVKCRDHMPKGQKITTTLDKYATGFDLLYDNNSKE